MSKEFTKPATRQPTRHLFLGNVGPAVGVSESAISAVLQQFGGHSITVPDLSQARSFATFENAQAAEQAALLLQRPLPELGSRQLTVKFAALAGEHKAEPTDWIRTEAFQAEVPGLTLLHDFITAEEETALISAVEHCAWETLARRRVQHYGHRFEYQIRSVDRSRPAAAMPAAVQAVLQRLSTQLHGWAPDQLTVNDYEPGIGLSPHIDTHSAFAGPIVSLSLNGPAAMDFRRQGARQSLWLPARSLLIMDGDARLAWAHYIPHRKADPVLGRGWVPRGRRISFTFRQVREGPCRCAFPECCDSQTGQLPPTRSALAAQQQQQTGATHGADCTSCDSRHETVDAGNAAMSGKTESCEQVNTGPGCKQHAAHAQLESAYVHKVYDAIAPHFSSTRFAIWPKVKQFIRELEPGAVVADVGCGNGKYFGVRSDIAVLGSDRSPGLAQVAARRLQATGGVPACQHADVAVADGMRLPYRAQSLDAVLCIAVLHHISSAERRAAMLTELTRVLRPGGRALITVWATKQDEPQKLAKWQPITAPAVQSGRVASDTTGDDVEGVQQPDAQQALEQHQNDYFVPWHLPFHRAEASAAAAQAAGSWDAGEACDAAADSGAPVLDRTKGTIVFKRFYHLFDADELRSLAEHVDGCRVADLFYDKSNWCIILKRT